MNGALNQPLKPIKLAYIIGTYPGLTMTFIDREIQTLRRLGTCQVRTLSMRSPDSVSSLSAEQKAACANTLYLIPPRWSKFNYLAFIAANLYFVVTRPLVFFNTLIYLLTRPHPDNHSRLQTLLHFEEGVYAAYLLRHEGIDHLHAHFIDRAVLVALVAGRLLDKPYSLTAHAADIYTRAVLVREKLSNARFVVTVSQYNKNHLLKTYPGIDPGKIHILHPWVDVAQFVPPASRPIRPRFHILSVGRLVEKKGHADLIDACALLHEQGLDFECQIVGEGPLRGELEKRITGHALEAKVHLLGPLPPERVLELLGLWADVFALPCVIASNGDRDGIPVSLAEAMAMELPVVSTDIVGIRELVQPGAGLLVPPHDAKALAGALHYISLHDQPTRLKMGQAGRAIVTAEFNLLNGTKILANLFLGAIAEEASASQEKLDRVSI